MKAMTDSRTTHLLGSGGALLGLALIGQASCAKPAWKQWGGPNRDFTVQAKGLASAWPEEGPRQLWRRDLGDGFSTIVSDGKVVYAMYRAGKDSQESVVALDAQTGDTVWEYNYDAPFIRFDKKTKQPTKHGYGPNSTPLLIGDRLYTIGYTSILHCLDARTGRRIWTHDLYGEFNGTFLLWGYSASPIEYGDTIITLVGGKGQGIVAFDKETGDPVWKGADFDCSYSSPILIDVDGEDHLVAFMSKNIVGLDPANGEVHWALEHKNQWGTSISTPIWCPGNRLYFCVGGNSAGGRVIRLAKKADKITPEDIWTNKKIRGSLNNPIRIGEFFYGGSGNHSVKFMIGFSLEDGEIAWKERSIPEVKGVAADGKMILLDEDGNLMIATTRHEGIKVHAKAKLLDKPAWSAPTLVGTRLFLRDKKTIVAVDLG